MNASYQSGLVLLAALLWLPACGGPILMDAPATRNPEVTPVPSGDTHRIAKLQPRSVLFNAEELRFEFAAGDRGRYRACAYIKEGQPTKEAAPAKGPSPGPDSVGQLEILRPAVDCGSVPPRKLEDSAEQLSFFTEAPDGLRVLPELRLLLQVSVSGVIPEEVLRPLISRHSFVLLVSYRDSAKRVQALRFQAPDDSGDHVLLLRSADGAAFVEHTGQTDLSDLVAAPSELVHSWQPEGGERLMLLQGARQPGDVHAQLKGVAFSIMSNARLPDRIYAGPAEMSMLAEHDEESTRGCGASDDSCCGLANAPMACLAFGCLYWTFVINDSP